MNMGRNLLILLMLVFFNAAAFAETATFHVAETDLEDTSAGLGLYGSSNDFDNPNGWHFFGYSRYTYAYYNAYWRWALTIPKGSIINHAYVRIRSDYTNSGNLDAAFQALVADKRWETGKGFNRESYPNGTALKNIPLQGTPVVWAITDSWNEGGWHVSPDIADLVQERLWNVGYAPDGEEGKYFGLVLKHVSGYAYRTGTQQPDDNSFVAELYVDWTPNFDGMPEYESTVFHVGDSDIEDTYAEGRVGGTNGFADINGHQYVGYSALTGAIYDSYWRWPLTVPKGATIVEAYVRLRSNYTTSGLVDTALEALSPDGKWEESGGFGADNYPDGMTLTDIPRQGLSVVWDLMPDWTVGDWYQSPDIANLVQARIDNGDYDPFDINYRHFGLVLSYTAGSGYRVATQEPHDDTLTAHLFVKWIPPDDGCEEVEVCGDGIDNDCDGEIDEFCNTCPIAEAGGDQSVYRGDIVLLDGSGSSDADGDQLAYVWSLVSRPEGSSAALSGSLTATPAFVADAPGDYIIELVVDDGACSSEPDTCIVTAFMPEYLCPMGMGYWKNHSDEWPVQSMRLGAVNYTRDELLAILKRPVKGDASMLLARQLISAKLNIANGSDPRPVEETVIVADQLLSGFSGPLPYKVKPSSGTGRSMLEAAKVLDAYNKGELTPECEP